MELVSDWYRISVDSAGRIVEQMTNVIGIKNGGQGSLDVEPLVKPASASKSIKVCESDFVVRLFGNTSPWIRMAGLSGAVAVALGAYGAHGLKNVSDEQRAVYETANRYHFIHTLALLAVPLTNRPNLVGPMLLLGTVVFSGTCYVHGMTGNQDIIKWTPYGGMTLIFAWIAMIL